MELPKRTAQLAAESESYAILLYKLRKLGIFRNVTENDYGVDFEIELIVDDKLIGRYFKAQVKSAAEIKPRKRDNIPTVGGIKQSTLSYWCSLSTHTHVLAYAVDLKTEEIYVSRPLFWQATKLIDGTKKSKSIEFLPKSERPFDAYKKTVLFSVSPLAPDTIHAHTTALRNLRQLFELYADVFHYDPGSELPDPWVFHVFLDVCKVILWIGEGRKFDGKFPPEIEVSKVFSFSYWATKSNTSGTDVTNHIAQIPMKILFPFLIERLRELRQDVLDGIYYWSYKNRAYLEMVHKAALPQDADEKTILEWAYHFETQAAKAPYSGELWMKIREARELASEAARQAHGTDSEPSDA